LVDNRWVATRARSTKPRLRALLALNTPLTVRWAIIVLAVSITALVVALYLSFELTRCAVALQSYEASRTFVNREHAVSVCRILFKG
jgi:hypothetical protein